jgi:hypothetical protein
VINVTQVSTAHAGSSGMKLQAWTYQGFVFSPVATCPNNNNMFAYNGRPQALNGWYAANLAGGDKLYISGVTEAGGSSHGGTALTITTSATVYQQFSAPFIYSVAGNSDSAVVAIMIQSASGSAIGLNSASYAIIDDLSFGNAVATGLNSGFKESAELTVAMNGTALRCTYTSGASGNVRLSILDLTGKEVGVLVDGSLGAGRFRVDHSTVGMQNGIYLLKLESPDGILVKKTVVTH